MSQNALHMGSARPSGASQKSHWDARWSQGSRFSGALCRPISEAVSVRAKTKSKSTPRTIWEKWTFETEERNDCIDQGLAEKGLGQVQPMRASRATLVLGCGSSRTHL